MKKEPSFFDKLLKQLRHMNFEHVVNIIPPSAIQIGSNLAISKS